LSRGIFAPDTVPNPSLFGVDLELTKGECLAPVGTNGAGKTTTIRAILGLIRTSGVILIEGAAVERLATARLVRDHAIAIVRECRGLLKRLTVLENIVLGLRRAAHSRLDEALDLFPALRNRLKEPVSLLSGVSGKWFHWRVPSWSGRASSYSTNPRSDLRPASSMKSTAILESCGKRV
jgi:ABC-type branched-subunit amino acid transport system ATPase component